MRISGGTLRGRNLRTPTGTDFLRPTQDSVREAVFSMLSAVIDQAYFLDIFAGTGAVGLEAFSRGAASVVWIERDRRAMRLLEANIEACIPKESAPLMRAVCSEVATWLRHPDIPQGSVTIAYADPPYVAAEGLPDSIPDLMRQLDSAGILAQRAIFVAEQRARTPIPEVEHFSRIDTRRYGRTQVSLYRYEP